MTVPQLALSIYSDHSVDVKQFEHLAAEAWTAAPFILLKTFTIIKL